MTLQHASPEQLVSILQELNETSEEKRNAALQNIKIWLVSQPHLPNKMDERMILSIIRGCKHDLTRTKSKLDMYFTMRADAPELFSERDPLNEDVQGMFKTMDVFPLENLTPAGCRVTFHKFRDTDPASFTARACFKFVFMLGDIRMMEEQAISGDVYLFDMQGMTFGHLTRLAMPVLRRMLTCAQDAYPQRLKQIHLFNVPNYIDKLLTLFRSLMKEKMRSRFQVHSGHETLHKHLPPECIPNEYGGSAGEVDVLKASWKAKIESYQSWFLEQEHVKVVEGKRPGKQKHLLEQDNIYGWEGSFRKLAID
ncbi:alpha-tocopherol transfer protein-like [Cloeon dipterum]|uniref:alpha-tocopherol transfer protein-like n=1 Tax=Cloeon dipterum TaxID=197152 RepID=UPI0032205D98